MPQAGAIGLVVGQLACGKTAGVEAPDSIGRGGRIISESGAAMIRVGIVRAESCEEFSDQPASFRMNFVMRKPSERPAVYGSGCEGVPEAKRLAG